jgi:hypothetical protein
MAVRLQKDLYKFLYITYIIYKQAYLKESVSKIIDKE